MLQVPGIRAPGKRLCHSSQGEGKEQGFSKAMGKEKDFTVITKVKEGVQG